MPDKTMRQICWICLSAICFLQLSLCGCVDSICSSPKLTFGQAQLRHMMKDRPLMRLYESADGTKKTVSESDTIWEWAVRRLSGEQLGQVIHWNPEEPDKPKAYSADHRYPSGNRKGFIRVRKKYLLGKLKGRPIPFEALWFFLVFELNNIEGAAQFHRLYEEALEGRVSRTSWITRNTMIEYNALCKTVAFYNDVWAPWAAKNGFETNAEVWRTNLPDTYRKWIQQYRDKTGYPWDTWGHYYDTQMVPYLRRVDAANKSHTAEESRS